MPHPFENFVPFLGAVYDQWATLLTGCVGIAVINLLAKHFNKPLTLKQDLSIGLVLLFYATFQAWNVNYKKSLDLATELNTLTKPVFHLRFSQWTFGKIPAYPGSTFLTIQIALTNTGAPSILEDWQASVIESDKTVYKGIYAVTPTEIPLNLGGLLLYPEDSLFIKQVNDPVITGGKRTGWVMFQFNGLQADIRKPDSLIDLSVTDVYGATHHSEQKMIGDGDTQMPTYFPGFKLPPAPAQKEANP